MKEQKKQFEKNTALLAETVTTRAGKIIKYKVRFNGEQHDIYFHPELIRTGDLIEYTAVYSDIKKLSSKPIFENTYKNKGTTVDKYIEEKTDELYSELQKGNIPYILEESFFIEIIKQNALSKLFLQTKKQKLMSRFC